MQVTVFGASGSVGRYIVKALVKKHYNVIAVSRNSSSLIKEKYIYPKSVDYTNLDSIKQALYGSYAVIIVLGDRKVAKPTEKIIMAMKALGIQRVEIITAFGTSKEAKRQLNILPRIILASTRIMMPGTLRQKELQDKIVSRSGLNYTVVQTPPRLTNDIIVNSYEFGKYPNNALRTKISRANLADFAVSNISKRQFIKQTVFVYES